MSEREKTVLLEVLGASPELEVVDALADTPVFDLTADEISDISGVDVGEVEDVLAKLEFWDVVDMKTFEGEECYTLNTSNDAVCHLLRFEFELIDREPREGSTP